MAEREVIESSVDVDPTDGRNETENQRMDRNWNELLQELRVTQTGTQILSGFLLAIAFQPRFTQLDHFQRTVYLILVVASAFSTALALAPVNIHRSLFRKRAKAQLVQMGHVILRCTLLGVAVILTGTLLLIFDVTVGRAAALAVTVIAVVVIVALALLPVFFGRPRGAGVRP
jgi:Family of unknown function (DUF6328)